MGAVQVEIAGKHSPEAYVRLLLAIHSHKLSGSLRVEVGRRHRVLGFVQGVPVYYDSNLDEESLEHTVVNAKLIPKKRMSWVVEKLGPEEQLRDALVLSGAVTEQQLDEHLSTRLRVGIGASLSWARGDWTWRPLPVELAGRIEPALIPDTSLLGPVWLSVKQHLTMDDVIPAVMDTALGRLQPGPSLEVDFEKIGLDGGLEDLVTAMGGGCTVDDLASKVRDRSGDLLKLVWMLQIGGQICRENPITVPDFVQQVIAGKAGAPAKKKGSPSKAPSKKAPKSGDDASADARLELNDKTIASLYESRMGTDFYVFLGLGADSSVDDVQVALRRLGTAWRGAVADRALSKASREKAQEMLQGLQMVRRMFSDSEKKSEYDRRLEGGRAPVVELIRAASLGSAKARPKPTPPPEAAAPADDGQRALVRTLMDKGHHKDALAMLRQLRLEDPSDPDVLADLGWAEWRTKGASAKDPEAADEFLRLALTFNPSHARALEYHARIGMEMGNSEEAVVRLKRVLAVDKSASWARQALADLESGNAPPSGGKGGRFWRKGGA